MVRWRARGPEVWIPALLYTNHGKMINKGIVMFLLVLYIIVLKRLAEDWFLTLLEPVSSYSL